MHGSSCEYCCSAAQENSNYVPGQLDMAVNYICCYYNMDKTKATIMMVVQAPFNDSCSWMGYSVLNVMVWLLAENIELRVPVAWCLDKMEGTEPVYWVPRLFVRLSNQMSIEQVWLIPVPHGTLCVCGTHGCCTSLELNRALHLGSPLNPSNHMPNIALEAYSLGDCAIPLQNVLDALVVLSSGFVLSTGCL